MSGNTKIAISVLSLGLCSLIVPAAAAQTTAPTTTAAPATSPAPAGSAVPAGKIAIVNIQDAIVATDEGKKEFDALKQRFSPKETELKSQNDEVENLKKQLDAQGATLSDTEKNNRVKALETKQKSLQRNYEDAQNEFQQAEQEVVSRIGNKMLSVLDKYAKGNGYTVILDVSSQQTPVLWADQSTNITKALVDAYNAEYPSSAAAAPAATRPAAPRPSAPRTTTGTTTRPPAPAPTTPKKP